MIDIVARLRSLAARSENHAASALHTEAAYHIEALEQQLAARDAQVAFLQERYDSELRFIGKAI